MTAETHTAAELEALLSESMEAAQARERNAFDIAAGARAGRIVIYGAGNLGRRIARALAAHLEVAAFADADPAKWGTEVEGRPVLSPDHAAQRFRNAAAFVVAVWHPAPSGGIASIMEMLAGLGCRTVPFVTLSWKFPETLLPYYLWDLPSRALAERDAIHRAYELFDAEDSRAEFVRQVRLRLTADFTCTAAPSTEPQYFSPGLFPPLSDECFLDCGAFNGDTIAAFRTWTGDAFRRVVAFEADPANFRALQEYVATNGLADRVTVHPHAVAETAGRVRFTAVGAGSSAISNAGAIEVESVRIDDLAERPTFIKMDIEGAEEAALRGARQTLQRERPVLALCVYHRQNHLWRIPLLAAETGGYSFALRSYCLDGLDTVCFAVPPHRQVKP